MQEKEIFNIDQVFIDELLQDDISQEVSENKFTEFLKNIDSKINSMLSSYHQSDGERGDVYDFAMQEYSFSCSLSENSLQGMFILDYEAHYYYGCDDMNNSNKYSMEFSFIITNNTITISGEDWPVREPDEY